MAIEKKPPSPAPAGKTEPTSPLIAAGIAADKAEKIAPESPKVEAPTERRGPGRPKGSGNAAPVSPSEASAAASSGRKGPGRPKGGKSKVSFDADAQSQLAKQLMGLHQLAALATGIPEMAINETEAVMLGAAVANVCEEYDLSLSGKTGALVQLLAAAAMVYVPRVQHVGARIRAAKAAQAREGLHVVGGNNGAPPSHS